MNHVIRMGNDRISKQLLYVKLSKRETNHSSPVNPFKECIKANNAHMRIAIKKLEEYMQDDVP